jgi:hypothetical protein
MPSLGMVGRITTLRLQHSPTSGHTPFSIANCDDVRLLQPFRAGWNTFAIGQGAVSAELKSEAERGLSKAGLMLFMQPGSRRGCV